jgi:predicted O-linked N-acetylglucosamine transferase (SPINDLY family)
MGVPFITLAGRPSVGRLGSCILHSIRRTEWIAASETEYVAKAAALAADLDGLAKIRTGLRGEMDSSALLDEPAFARKVEAAYREMFRIWCEKQT